MKSIKVGVVGLGRMGQQHCRVYSTLRRAQLVGVHDVNPELGAATAATRWKCHSLPTLRSYWRRWKRSAWLLQRQATLIFRMTCLDHGVHLLVEKPITETLEQADQLTRTAEQSDLVVQVGHIERFNPAYIELKNVLEDFHMLAVNFRRLSAYSGSNKDVNVVLDLMIHDLDLVLDMIGEEPEEIVAYGLTALGNAVDHVNVQLSFKSGPMVSMTASTDH